MKSIAFFNNKGGVGKTTLACNLVSYLNMHKGKRVLLVDADPQCNATQAILEDELTESIYLDPASTTNTIYSYLKPFEDGESDLSLPVRPLLGTSNRFKTDLIPGHPRMSIIEDQLSSAWSDLLGRKVGGYRVTNWCHQLIRSMEGQYDLIVFDVGPSLGALNRSVILGCDYMVTPFGCDIFSLLGIKNISQWISAWELQYTRSVKDLQLDRPAAFEEFGLVSDVSLKHRFLGYSVQQYVSRQFKTGPRPVKSYDEIMRKIPDTVREAMQAFTPTNISLGNLELGHIPYLYSLVPMAQAAKSPIHALTNADGVIGSQYGQVKSYSSIINALSDKLLVNVGRL